MKNNVLIGFILLGIAATSIVISALPSATAEDEPRAADIREVIMYGVDSDTDELLRYAFFDDSYRVVAKLTSESGTGLEDVEALAYVPNGPAKGMYCSPVAGGLQGHLCRIDPLTGIVTVTASRTCGDGLRGLVAVPDPDAGWRLLGACETARELWWIDPVTAAVTVITEVDHRYDGLALGADGTIYGATTEALYRIDLADPSDPVEVHLGDHGYEKVEALEFVSGDFTTAIDLPGVPAEWTAGGLLLAFDDNSNALLVVHPGTGASMVLMSSFDTVDCEGLVLVTTRNDPLGFILSNIYD